MSSGLIIPPSSDNRKADAPESAFFVIDIIGNNGFVETFPKPSQRSGEESERLYRNRHRPMSNSDAIAGFTPEEHIAAVTSRHVRNSRITVVEIDSELIVLTRVEGQACAFNALCPHQLGNLASGMIINGEIECPVHNWRFNIRTGKSVYPEDDGLRLRRYEAKEENGMVKVRPGRN